MKTLAYEQVVWAVRELCRDSACRLPEDVLDALKTAVRKESNPQARQILEHLIENARLAEQKNIPLCQDTGLAVVFVEIGADVTITPPQNPGAALIDAINQGVAEGYEKFLLRKSVVADPLNKRVNTLTNTPAVIHCDIVPGDKLKLTLMTKGGGCENKSQFAMFNPTESLSSVSGWIVKVVKEAGADACPPFIVGIGIGGDFELCCLLSKKALLRKIGTENPAPFYRKMESELLGQINASGIGPQGLGGDTTALAVQIETAPCHIASLPVAVNIECHSHRHKTAVL